MPTLGRDEVSRHKDRFEPPDDGLYDGFLIRRFHFLSSCYKTDCKSVLPAGAPAMSKQGRRKAAASSKAAEQQPAAVKPRDKPKHQPRYHVVLWDDDDHTYDYVIRMMGDLFRHSKEKGMQIATEVDTAGRAICLTTTMEHAELKRDQIHAYGRDELMEQCRGSMRATIEPAESSP